MVAAGKARNEVRGQPTGTTGTNRPKLIVMDGIALLSDVYLTKPSARISDVSMCFLSLLPTSVTLTLVLTKLNGRKVGQTEG